MLVRTNNTTISDQSPFQGLLNIADQAFPRTPQQMLALEQELSIAGAQAGDAVMLKHLKLAHSDAEFVAQAIAAARERSPVDLEHNGLRVTSVLLLGGTRVTISTPYLKVNRSKSRGRKRKKRHAGKSGCYPVLEALGIADRVSPATRSQIAMHIVQSASYAEAALVLAQRGFKVEGETLAAVAESTAKVSIELRDAAIEAARKVAVPQDGPLAGKRVRVSTDGGRVRIRVGKRGRKNKKGRHGFTSSWREPRLLVIDILDEEGKPDRLQLPLYDAVIGDADTVAALIIGYLRLLGAAAAQIVEFIADGAEWIWDRAEKIRSEAEIPSEKFVEVLDFYHASQYLCRTVELCRKLSACERKSLYEHLRHLLRHDPKGVEQVIEQLSLRAVTRRGKVINKAIEFFRQHKHRMHYHQLDTLHLPVGSGQVESAVRRVVNLRFKAPGTFWLEERVSALLHLRAIFKSGRWDEAIPGIISGVFQVPGFDPIDTAVARTRAVVEEQELFDSCVTDPLVDDSFHQEVAA